MGSSVYNRPFSPLVDVIADMSHDVAEWGGYVRGKPGYKENKLEFFPGQTYADFDPATEQAFAGIEGLAGGVSPSQEAGGYLGDVLGGEYQVGGENANPYAQDMRDSIIEPMMERYREEFMPGMQQQWFGAHGGASPGMAQTMARESRQALDEVNRAEGSILGGLWENERGRMQNAAALAPGIERANYTPYEMLRGVGADREAQANLGIGEEMARHEFAQTEPIRRVEMAYPYIMGPGATFTTQKGKGGGGGSLAGQLAGGALSLAGSAASGGAFNNLGGMFGGMFGGGQPAAGNSGQSIFGAGNSAGGYGGPFGNLLSIFGRV